MRGPRGQIPAVTDLSAVERDLARWQAEGWVSEAGASQIRADLSSRRSAFGIASIFAVLGAVLFGFAVMSFVAAHWTGMSKLARLGLLLVTLWACYGAAAYLFLRQLNAFAHAALLGGIAVFVGAFVIYNTFSITVAQRTRELALLRTLGASPSTIFMRMSCTDVPVNGRSPASRPVLLAVARALEVPLRARNELLLAARALGYAPAVLLP